MAQAIATWNTCVGGTETSLTLEALLAKHDESKAWREPAYLVVLAQKFATSADDDVSVPLVEAGLSCVRSGAERAALQAGELALAVTRCTCWQLNLKLRQLFAGMAFDVLESAAVQQQATAPAGPRCECALDTPTEAVLLGADTRDAQSATALFLRGLRRVYVYGSGVFLPCRRVAALCERHCASDDAGVRLEAAALLMVALSAIDRHGGVESYYAPALRSAYDGSVGRLAWWTESGWPVRVAVAVRYLRWNREYDFKLVHVAPSIMATDVAASDDGDSVVVLINELQHVVRRQLQAWWGTLAQRMRAGDAYAACALSVHHRRSIRQEVVQALLEAAPRAADLDATPEVRAVARTSAHALELMGIRAGVRWHESLRVVIPRRRAESPLFRFKIDAPDADLPVCQGNRQMWRVHRVVLQNSARTQRWAKHLMDTWYSGKDAKLVLPGELAPPEARAVFEYVYGAEPELDTLSACVCVYDAARYFMVDKLMHVCAQRMVDFIMKKQASAPQVAAVCDRACSDHPDDACAWKQRKRQLLLYFVRHLLYDGGWVSGVTPSAVRAAHELVVQTLC